MPADAGICLSSSGWLFRPTVLQSGDLVEHRAASAVVHPVGHEVTEALELELIVGLGGGQ